MSTSLPLSGVCLGYAMTQGKLAASVLNKRMHGFASTTYPVSVNTAN